MSRWRHHGARLAALLLIAWCGLPSVTGVRLRAGSLASVSPAGASTGIAINITGTGFHTTAANNEVTFTPLSGAPVTAMGQSITTVNAAQGLRRLRVTVPAGLPAGRAALRVRNIVSGELSAGQHVEVVTIALDVSSGARGAAQIPVRITGSPNSQFQNGSTRAAFATGVTVHSTTVQSATSLTATISIAATAPLGPGAVSVISGTQTATLAGAFAIVDPNRPPAITSTPIVESDEGQQYSYQVTATDPDDDAISFRLITAPAGMTIAAGGLIAWNPTAAQVGSQPVDVEASDGRGGTTHQAFQVLVRAAPIVSIDLTPASTRFSTLNAARQLEVIGRRSNGATVDLTAGSSGTTYENSNPFVASISPDGLLTGVANGSTTITAHNGTLSDSGSVTVELNVTLDSLQLTPASSTLRASGAQQPLQLTGQFSDGTTRDLTTSDATSYESSDGLVAGVTADGRAIAVANGETTITARHDSLSATVIVRVIISEGSGHVRGEVYDDVRGLPLAGATVTLLSDGGGPLSPPVTAVADDRGRYTLAGRAGDCVLRITKAGFSSVERRGSIPSGGSVTVLDARLTSITGATASIGSAFGGVVRDGSQRFALQVPPGGVAAETAFSLTAISPQGLAGRLPLGWSPVVAAQIEPAATRFGLPAALTLPNIADLAPGTELTLARYSPEHHEWVAESTIEVSADGLTLVSPVRAAGQVAVLMPDAAPLAPPAAVAGGPVQGVAAQAAPTGLSVAGDVVPRSAPPGEGVRALGRIGANAAAPMSSGTVLQVDVQERFDLLDQSQVVTRPFTQDIVVYARPRVVSGSLGASFPITPSRAFTIQELMLGVVRLGVFAPRADGGTPIVGAAGGSVSNAIGDTLDLPPGSLAQASAIELHRLTPDQLALTIADFDLLAAVRIEAVGSVFAVPATLSIPAPAGVTSNAQIFVARLHSDPFGVRRLKVAAVGQLGAGRLTSARDVAGLTLPGITSEGDYLFLRARVPFGFTAGIVTSGDASPRALALVTLANGPFADVTALDGRYVVPTAAASNDTVRALDSVTRATASGPTQPAGRDAVVAVNLTLTAAGLSVVNIAPAAGASNVPLDTSVTIDFAAPLDATTITDATAALHVAGTSVAVQRTLSADRRRLTLRPTSPLAGRTLFTVTLTAAIRDAAGNALAGFSSSSFETLDPTRPAPLATGQIVAELPDEDGFVLVTGAAGTAASNAPVTVINLRTQETLTVLAQANGSFRARVAARIGDELSLMLREAGGRETTIAMTQLGVPGGPAGIGARGGRFDGAGGRRGSLLPRSLAEPGIFEIEAASDDPLPALPAGFTYADRFALTIEGGSFAAVESLSLSESQNRFAAQLALDAPFEATASLTIPADVLVSSTIGLTASVQDATGARRSVNAATGIVASSPDTSLREASHTADFPSLFLEAPVESVPNQEIGVRAIAPAARVELERPVIAGVPAADTLLLVRSVEIAGASRLEIVDRLAAVDANGTTLLRTVGRELPGMSAPGQFAIVAASEPLAFVTGRASGTPTAVVAAGLPFVASTGGPNGRFVVPVRASQPFSLQLLALDGTVRGIASGAAPQSGRLDIGDPLGATAGRLTVTAQPNERSAANPDAPLVFRFSEPIDGRGLGSLIMVTDEVGSRVFGQTALDAEGQTLTFRPARRWRFGATYRYALASALQARSGARLGAPFGGRFTTFAPRIIGRLDVGNTHDIAISDELAVAGTDAGLAILNVAAPQTVSLHTRMPSTGATHAVALLPDASMTDRGGATRSGTFAVAASTTAGAAGVLQVVDVGVPETPAVLGSTLLSAPGTAAGTPSALLVDSSHRALVAIESVGVSSVALGQTIPADAENPVQGLGPRYPAGNETATQVAMLGDRLLVTGAAGLTVLDASTLARRGGASTDGTARGVAALEAFSMDVNGDGTIAADEQFDTAVVADGANRALQFFRVPATGDPELFSVVRFAGETHAVVVDAVERLAYVGIGSRGVAFVDLDGPASLQPIDANRDGIDDRVLGIVDSAGVAGRLALDPSRGLALVADGPAGMAVVQTIAPRIAFASLTRDPVRAMSGDEQRIVDPGGAFTSDDAVIVAVRSVMPPGEVAFLTIDESGAAADRMLSFEGGVSAVPVTGGSQSFVVRIFAPRSTTARAVLNVRSPSGETLASAPLSIGPPDTAGAALRTLRIAPRAPVIPADQTTAQLSVLGAFSSGLMLNLTSSLSGTRYATTDGRIATVSADGLVSAAAGGRTGVVATNEDVRASDVLTVQHPARLVAFQVARPRLMLTALGAQLATGVTARLSDGSTLEAASVVGTTFTTSDPSVVTVDGAGVLTARGEGAAVVTAINGEVRADLDVAAEFRVAPNLTGIQLSPFPAGTTTDEATVTARASVAGSGSLEGLTVTFTASAGSVASGASVTSFDGTVVAVLEGFSSPGTFTVTASVVNPASGQTLTDSALVTVAAGSGDFEPNDGGAATASRLAEDRRINGTLDGGADRSDTFRLEAAAAGTFSATLTFPSGTNLAGITIVIRDANGVEVARFTPTSLTSTFTVPGAARSLFLSIESAAAVQYAVESRFVQGNITITSVAPLGGEPGTLVQIDGSGFSTIAAQTRVLFGGVAGKIETVGPNRIQARVPANAVNGPLEVISGSSRATGPAFTTGNAGPLPPAYVLPQTISVYRFDPVSQQTIDIKRINVHFDPLATRAQAEALGTRLGGTIVGINPTLNAYLFEFPSNQTIAGALSLAQTFEAEPSVRYALPARLIRPSALAIDTRDIAGAFVGSITPMGVAYQQAGIFDAFETIRSTPPFDVSPAPFQPVRIAVIDSGFEPSIPRDFQTPSGANFVTHLTSNGTGGFSSSVYVDPVVCPAVPTQTCDGGHGTAVTSIMAAVNDGANMSGAVTGVLRPGEPLPFNFRVYKTAYNAGQSVELDSTLLTNAMTHVAIVSGTSSALDVVNMSWGAQYDSGGYFFDRARQEYRDVLSLWAGRTLGVAAAGNDGVDARYHLPSSLQDELPHIISVGAVAVADGDNTGEIAGARAVFGTTPTSGAPPCTPTAPTTGSNCGNAVTIAAPGEDVQMMRAVSDRFTPGYFFQFESHGTSMAAPITASVAALVQSLRAPGAQALRPDAVRRILLETSVDISATWSPGTMRQVNALGAVRAMLQLPPDNQHVYVADNNAPADNGREGKIIGINIDPRTGQRTVDSGDDREISLSFVHGTTVFHGVSPSALVTSPIGDKLYAIVRAHDPPIGEGLLVLSTNGFRPQNFIAFSGEPLDAVEAETAEIVPVASSGHKAGMAVTKDGRLMYVAAGPEILIVNLVQEKVVRTFQDLPAPYNILDILQPPADLRRRRDLVSQAVQGAPRVGRGLMVAGLTLSPDGTILYAVVNSGGGSGQQPGAVIAIDVDLYRDGMADVPGLQSELSNYFSVLRTMRMAGTSGAAGGDEPTSVAVSGDGEHLYLMNGGASAYQGITPNSLDLDKFFLLVGGPVFATMMGSPAGFIGVATSMASFTTIAPQLYRDLERDIIDIANGGMTILAAPGFTGVFNATPHAPGFGNQTFLFPSDMVFGWAPSPVNGGLIIDQFHFPNVFARRPFDIAICPRCSIPGQSTLRSRHRRAIVPFFATGNFGLLDLDLQTSLRRAQLAAVPSDVFRGFVAVTPALSLDSHLWPRRGVFRADGVRIPSPDERLLYPTTVRYAQNGRFAVASHTGNLPRTEITVNLPDFEHDIAGAAVPLQELGFTLNGASGLDPEGRPISVGSPYTFRRGGGAISLISDEVMANDFAAHAGQPAGGAHPARPYFAVHPLTSAAVTHVYDFDAGFGPEPLFEPRGIAVQPFVSIESPRFGEIIPRGSPIQVTWRDSRVRNYTLNLFDLSVSINGNHPVLNSAFGSFTAAQIQSRSASLAIADVFRGIAPPVPGQWYRLEVQVEDDQANELSIVSVDIRFER